MHRQDQHPKPRHLLPDPASRLDAIHSRHPDIHQHQVGNGLPDDSYRSVTIRRLNAAALIVNALLVVPGLFVDTTALIRVITAVIITATVAAVVLMMQRSETPSRVVD